MKWLFRVVDFLQKTNETSLIAVKLNSFVRFLEKIEDTQNLFEIIEPLMFPYFLTNLLIITSKSCPRGQRVTPDGKSCVDRNECLDNPCRNNGQCINRDTVERYTCLCPTGFSGNNCELMQEEQILRLSMGALAIILLCLLSILSKDNSIIKNKLTA